MEIDTSGHTSSEREQQKNHWRGKWVKKKNHGMFYWFYIYDSKNTSFMFSFSVGIIKY